MNHHPTYPAYRKCLLPLIMALAVFFVSQGIDLPSFGTLEGPQLCAPRKTKTSDGAFTKSHQKISQTKSTKSAPAYALAGDRIRVKSPVVLLSNCLQPHCSCASSAATVLSARAPPTA
jgi:hypothetical protein